MTQADPSYSALTPISIPAIAGGATAPYTAAIPISILAGLVNLFLNALATAGDTVRPWLVTNGDIPAGSTTAQLNSTVTGSGGNMQRLLDVNGVALDLVGGGSSAQRAILDSQLTGFIVFQRVADSGAGTGVTVEIEGLNPGPSGPRPSYSAQAAPANGQRTAAISTAGLPGYITVGWSRVATGADVAGVYWCGPDVAAGSGAPAAALLLGTLTGGAGTAIVQIPPASQPGWLSIERSGGATVGLTFTLSTGGNSGADQGAGGGGGGGGGGPYWNVGGNANAALTGGSTTGAATVSAVTTLALTGTNVTTTATGTGVSASAPTSVTSDTSSANATTTANGATTANVSRTATAGTGVANADSTAIGAATSHANLVASITGGTTSNAQVQCTASAGGGQVLLGVGATVVNQFGLQSGVASNSGPTCLPVGTGAGQAGRILVQEIAAGGVNVTGFKSPDALAADVVYTMPLADATVAGQSLRSNAAQTLSWGGAVNVSATNANAQSVVNNNPATGVITWVELTDSANAFNNATGVFTVPAGAGGFYAISMSLQFAAIAAIVGAEYQAIVNRNGGTLYVGSKVNPVAALAQKAQVTVTVGLQLAAGDTIACQVSLTGAGGNVALTADPTTNLLTITQVSG